MARPTKLNKEVREAICKALRSGNNRPAACAFGGVSYQTMLNWGKRAQLALARAEAGETIEDSEIPFVEFLEGVQKAEGNAEVGMVAVIHQAARQAVDGQWQAAAWWLERKHPDRWGRRERVENREPAGDKIQINVSGPASGEA